MLLVILGLEFNILYLLTKNVYGAVYTVYFLSVLNKQVKS